MNALVHFRIRPSFQIQNYIYFENMGLGIKFKLNKSKNEHLKKKTGRMNSTVYVNSTIYMNSTVYVNSFSITASEQCHEQ